MSPQQVMLEVRFIELSRTAGRELGVQWNRFGGSTLTNIGNRAAGFGSLPITSSQPMRSTLRQRQRRRRRAVGRLARSAS